MLRVGYIQRTQLFSMSATAPKYAKRMRVETKRNGSNKEFDFAVKDGTLWYFRFTVESGSYTGQQHIVEMKLKYGQEPDVFEYPLSAPMVYFRTPIWHPNISGTSGYVCLDVIKDNWTPMMKTEAIISALKAVLEDPNSSSPQNKAAGQMLDDDPAAYTQKVKEFYDYSKAPEDIRKLFEPITATSTATPSSTTTPSSTMAPSSTSSTKK